MGRLGVGISATMPWCAKDLYKILRVGVNFFFCKYIKESNLFLQ